MDIAKKLSHEKFISDHTGSSFAEPLAFIYLMSVLVTLKIFFWFKFHWLGNTYWRSLCLDIFGIIMPYMLLVTVLSKYLLPLIVTLLLVNLVIICVLPIDFKHPLQYKGKSYFSSTYFGSLLMTQTVIAIFAVDLPIFSRKYAKVESYGISLMDTGVGLFAAYNGCLGARTFAAPSNLRSMKFVLIVTFSGLIRTIAVKIVGYNEHVTEYGVHWNFFYTVALMRVFGLGTAHLTRAITRFASKLSGLDCRRWMPILFVTALGVCMYAVHDYILSSAYGLGLQDKLSVNGTQSWLTQPGARSNSFLMANAEGLASLPGYFTLYLLGVWCEFMVCIVSSRALVEDDSAKPPAKMNINRYINAIPLTLIWYLFTVSVFWKGEKSISRRLVNPEFIMFMTMVYGTIKHLSIVQELVWLSVRSRMKLLSYIDGSFCNNILMRNGMYFFVVANLSTGLSNLTGLTDWAKSDTSLGGPAWSEFRQLGLLTAYLLGNMTPFVIWHWYQLRKQKLL